MPDTADDRPVVCPDCGNRSQQSRTSTSPKRCTSCGTVMVDATESENEIWMKAHPDAGIWG